MENSDNLLRHGEVGETILGEGITTPDGDPIPRLPLNLLLIRLSDKLKVDQVLFRDQEIGTFRTLALSSTGLAVLL
jgi:hypothetical protein